MEEVGSTREALENAAVQASAKLGLQINGSVASASAIAEAFKVFQSSFNAYQDHVKRVAEENQSLAQENRRLQETVAALRKKRPASRKKNQRTKD